ncbi:MAG: hypothetical protein VX975_05855, partial [Acidobacteriota bacterium]|nr:hypothetical protein [Acidobacteriota bacterium]
MSQASRLDTERVKILGGLQGEVMVYQPMTIMEISRGGAQIETSFPLQLGSLRDLRWRGAPPRSSSRGVSPTPESPTWNSNRSSTS